ncbi:cytochrome P450, putative, partial [Bodo saltans]
MPFGVDLPENFVPVVLGLMFAAWAGIVTLYVLKRLKNNALMAPIPYISGAFIPYLGHAVYLAGGQPWDTFYKWASGCGWTCRLLILGRDVLYTSEPKLIKRILQTNQRIYRKDLELSYNEFMCILGRGLVTSEDQAWVRGRMLLSHAFRIDILDDIPDIAIRATKRLMNSLEGSKEKKSGSVVCVDLAESFRCLTLQVIAEAVLSFTPEESDAVFPSLYLPIVTECNERVWAPWRKLMFWSSGFRHRAQCLEKLNDFLANVVRQRWQSLQDAKAKGIAPAKHDIFGTCLNYVKEFSEDTVLQLRDDLKTFLLAGHETSAAMLSWAVYELCCRHPEYLEELRREHEAVFVSHGKANGTGSLPSVATL